MFFNILSIIAAYLMAFAAAAPTAENQQLAKRTFSGSEILSGVQDLISSCNSLSSLVQQHKWSGSAQSDDLISACTSISGDVDAFISGSADYNIVAEPIEGLVHGCANLVATLLDLCVKLAEWVLRVGVSACDVVVEHCAHFIFAILNCLLGFANGSSDLSGVISPIEHCLAVIQGCASWWGISISA